MINKEIQPINTKKGIKQRDKAREYLYNKANKEIQDNIKLARQCMNFQLIKCKNKKCKNESCPLNKKYD